MTEGKRAEGAVTAGFMVFKLGAAGSVVGLIAAVMSRAGGTGWPPVQPWLAYSLAVAVAGALVGLGALVIRTRTHEPDLGFGTAARPRRDMRPAVTEDAADRPGRPAVSAFRTVRKGNSALR